MPEDYFHYTRREIEQLLPENIDRVLEVGCGTGNTLVWLKNEKGCTWGGGIEISPDAFERARAVLDEAWLGNIESMALPIAENSLDLILCLDVLEHTVNPWQVLAKLHGLIKPGGSIIVSLPNVRNSKVIIPLLFKNEWKYQEAGILDKTHLRFFVRESAIELVKSAGFLVETVSSTGLGRSRRSTIVNNLLPPFIKSLFEYQYLIRGKKA